MPSRSAWRGREGGRTGEPPMLLDLPQHLVEPEQSRVHDLLAGADCNGRHPLVRAIASFSDGFDGGEVLVVAVRVAEEEELLHSRALLQSNGVVAEKLARHSYHRDVAVQQRNGEARANV